MHIDGRNSSLGNIVLLDQSPMAFVKGMWNSLWIPEYCHNNLFPGLITFSKDFVQIQSYIFLFCSQTEEQHPAHHFLIDMSYMNSPITSEIQFLCSYNGAC